MHRFDTDKEKAPRVIAGPVLYRSGLEMFSRELDPDLAIVLFSFMRRMIVLMTLFFWGTVPHQQRKNYSQRSKRHYLSPFR